MKRLDKDIETLFDDLGTTYKRQKPHTELLQSPMAVNTNKTETGFKKTYEKIKDIEVMVENYYRNLNSRVIAVRGIADKNTRRIVNAQRFLEDHGKNVSRT